MVRQLVARHATLPVGGRLASSLGGLLPLAAPSVRPGGTLLERANRAGQDKFARHAFQTPPPPPADAVRTAPRAAGEQHCERIAALTGMPRCMLPAYASLLKFSLAHRQDAPDAAFLSYRCLSAISRSYAALLTDVPPHPPSTTSTAGLNNAYAVGVATHAATAPPPCWRTLSSSAISALVINGSFLFVHIQRF